MYRLPWRLFLLVPLVLGLSGCTGKSRDRFKIGFVPKLTGIPYFNACKRGAEEAAQELKIDLDYNGPNKAEVNQQINLLNQWMNASEYDCLCIACCDPDAIARTLREARKKGLLVVTYDADTQEDARQFFVNMATYDAVAQAMVDEIANQLEPRGTGKVAILTSSIQAPNQSQWARRIKEYVKQRYADIELLPETEHGEDRGEGIQKAKALIQAHPDLKGIVGLTSVAVPAAAEAVRQSDRKGQIKVTGVSTPKDMRDYVKDGTVEAFILWNPVDLGYLTVHVADLLRKNQVPENGTIKAGRLGEIAVNQREVLLGKPMRFDKDNIDQYDF
jgi:ABC-type sugar transport system substrate-binding protein